MGKEGINQRLRRMRELQGWTQGQLAEILGTTSVNISRWENGSSPGIYYRRKLCEVFGKDAQELGLLEEDESEKPPTPSIPDEQQAERRSGLWPPSIPDEQYYHLPRRETNLETLLTVLQDPSGAQVVAIDGLGGLGKTAMASELAQRALHRHMFDGVLGESARQELLVGGEIVHLSEATLNFDSLLNSIASQLGLWELLTLESPEKHTKVVQILRQHHYLILVDNLESSENAQSLVWHLRSLLGPCRAIITSRQKIHLDFVHIHSLTGLALEDTRVFLQHDFALRGGLEWQNISQEKLVEIHKITGGAPLALKLVSAQSRFLGLNRALMQLQHGGNKLYPFIFRQSWEQLSPAAQRVLIYIGHTVITSIGWEELLEAELATDEQALMKAIDQLVTYSLLDVLSAADEIRYSIHQLTRQFVTSDLPAIWREQGLL